MEIAGYPAEEIRFEHDGVSVRLMSVARLEDHVDRERLLSAEDLADPPYWAHLWVGARALARFLASDAGLTPGVTTLDLGCGLGLTGLVAAARGSEIWFADLEPAALEFVRESLSRNAITRAHLRVLDFTRESLDRTFDVILGAEIVYDPAAYAPLADFVDRHLAPRGVFHATDAFRSDAVRFFDDLRGRGLRGERTAVREREDGRCQGAFLWSFRR